jgi:Tfp pilus assembly protein PilZ
MEEKRKYKRLVIKIPVKWRIGKHEKRSDADAFLFDTRNITTSGLFLKTTLRPKRDTCVDLRLSLDEKLKPLHLTGKIRWIASKRGHPYFYPGIGIKFDRLPPKKYQRLNNFIKKKLGNFRDAYELKDMYLKLKDMASRLVELEERHLTAIHFKKIIDSAIVEIDDVAHILDREINEIKKM